MADGEGADERHMDAHDEVVDAELVEDDHDVAADAPGHVDPATRASEVVASARSFFDLRRQVEDELLEARSARNRAYADAEVIVSQAEAVAGQVRLELDQARAAARGIADRALGEASKQAEELLAIARADAAGHQAKVERALEAAEDDRSAARDALVHAVRESDEIRLRALDEAQVVRQSLIDFAHERTQATLEDIEAMARNLHEALQAATAHVGDVLASVGSMREAARGALTLPAVEVSEALSVPSQSPAELGPVADVEEAFPADVASPPADEDLWPRPEEALEPEVLWTRPEEPVEESEPEVLWTRPDEPVEEFERGPEPEVLWTRPDEPVEEAEPEILWSRPEEPLEPEVLWTPSEVQIEPVEPEVAWTPAEELIETPDEVAQDVEEPVEEPEAGAAVEEWLPPEDDGSSKSRFMHTIGPLAPLAPRSTTVEATEADTPVASAGKSASESSKEPGRGLGRRRKKGGRLRRRD